jgi:uncharacterized protein involved in outer membrane biogenesis
MKKNALIIVGVIVLVLAVIVWQVVANLDSIVAGVIEDVGSDVLKTEVSVSGVSIDMKTGTAAIAGMTIANPDGYKSTNLFEMEGIEVQLDVSSVNKEVLLIKSIKISNPKINFEGDADGGSNMQTLMDNMDSGSSEETESSSGEASESDAKRMIIDRFEFSGGLVHAISEAKPGEEVDMKLPPISMSGIGKAEGGATTDVIAKEITNELVGAVIKAAAKAGISKEVEKRKKSFLDRLKGKD